MICDYTFPLNSKMNKHVVSVHKEVKPFRCEICDYICSLNSKMNKHVVLVHDDEGIQSDL